MIRLSLEKQAAKLEPKNRVGEDLVDRVLNRLKE